MVQGPEQRLHAALGAADDGAKAADAEMGDEASLGPDDVAEGDLGEIPPVGSPGRGIRRERAGGAAAPPQGVHADDEEPVRVDHPARADEGVPPSRLGVGGIVAPGDMMVAAEGVRDQDGVGGIRGQATVGLIPQLKARQRPAKLEGEGAVEGDIGRADDADAAGTVGVVAGRVVRHGPKRTRRRLPRQAKGVS